MPENVQTWERLSDDIIKYNRLKAELEEIKSRIESTKVEIISYMDELKINKHSVHEITDERVLNINCTLVSPSEVVYDMRAIQADYPACVTYDTVLSLDDAEHITAFKIKLKEYGLSDVKIRKLINECMTITEKSFVDEKKFQKKVDRGLVEDVSKYASVIPKQKYIKVVAKEINV